MTRDETDEERADRQWDDLLQELRVMQTGTQVTAAFLLSLPFQSRFDGLSDGQEVTYLALVVLAAVTTTMVLAPVALHRRLAGLHVKSRLVRSAQLAARATMAGVALLVAGVATFVFDVVAGRGVALPVGAVLVAVLVALLVVWPTVVLRRSGVAGDR